MKKYPKHPKVIIDHPGINMDGYKLILEVSNKLCLAGVSDTERARYIDEAFAGGYQNLLNVTGDWVTLKHRGHFGL